MSGVQAQEDVYVVKMSMCGQPSSVKVTVRDEQGPEGTSRLHPDSMDLVLKAGPSRKLLLDSPASTQCATRAVLAQLKVRVADVAGNFTDEGTFEVSACRTLPISSPVCSGVLQQSVP